MPVSWEEVPLMKVALLFIAGIFCCNLLSSCYLLTPVVLIYLIILLLRLIPGKKHLSLVRIGYRLTLIFFFLLGFLRMDPGLLDIPESLDKKNQIVVGRVLKTEQSSERQKYLVEILYMNRKTLPAHLAQRIHYYGLKGKRSKLVQGDIFLFQNKIYPVAGPENPHQFDYREYLLQRNIFGISFERNNTRIVQITKSKSNRTPYRERLLSKLNTHIKDPYAASICGAILFGQKEGLNSKQMDLFRKSGVAHVMAVSGMHVGIIFGLAWILLGRIPVKTPLQKVARLVLALSCIWGFIGVTGFPPSAVRAGVMFSFILAGKALYLHTNSLNLLAASAILMLMYEPNWIFDIGFQFSYLAVAGIILTYPSINKVITIPFRPIQWVWSLISISLAAQLFLLPLSVYYFFGFSPLFWLNSIPAAVIASATMSISILILIFNSISTPIADLLGFVLEKIILSFDDWLSYISLFKFSYLDAIGIDVWTLLFFFLFSLSIVFILIKPLKSVLILSCSILIIINISNITLNKTQKIITPLYLKEGMHIYIEDSSGCKCLSTINRSSRDWEFHIRGFEIKSHLTHCRIVNIFEDRHFYSIPGAKILIVHDPDAMEYHHAINASLVFWWCDEDPRSHLEKFPNARALYVKDQLLESMNLSSEKLLTDQNIKILAPGDPYILR